MLLVRLHGLRGAAADCYLALGFRTMVTTWDVPTGPADGPDEDDESDTKPSQLKDVDDTNSETPIRTPTARSLPLLGARTE